MHNNETKVLLSMQYQRECGGRLRYIHCKPGRAHRLSRTPILSCIMLYSTHLHLYYIKETRHLSLSPGSFSGNGVIPNMEKRVAWRSGGVLLPHMRLRRARPHVFLHRSGSNWIFPRPISGASSCCLVMLLAMEGGAAFGFRNITLGMFVLITPQRLYSSS